MQRALDFIERTMAHGAPERTALVRAERRFGVDRDFLRTLLQCEKEPSRTDARRPSSRNHLNEEN
jgi:hypothetical protein